MNKNLNFNQNKMKSSRSLSFCSNIFVWGVVFAALQVGVGVDVGVGFANPIQDVEKNSQPDVNFQADILPVLQARCFQCHAGENRDGDLRLDSRAAMEAGGHTGSEILGSVTDSELLRRITSSEDGYRMPKEGASLSALEVEKFRVWIADGAAWPVAKIAAVTPVDSNQNWADRMAGTWIAAGKQYEKPSVRYMIWLLVPAFGVALLGYLQGVSRRRRERKNAASHPVSKTAKPKTLSALLGVSAIGLLTVIAFLFGRLEEQRAEIATLEKLGPPTPAKSTQKSQPDFATAPEVQRPMHPPRLGGDYYRGNDERNESLFNGGFYRTANLNVQLVDRDGNEVDYQTDCSQEKLAIRFRMERATGATRELFTQRLLGSTFASKSFRGTDDATDKIMLQSEQDLDHWGLTYPITIPESGSTNGDLYLYYGSLDRNRIHYMIHYDLQLTDAGTLDSKSEVWMGSAYNLAGRVIVPGDDEIPLDHWFDFRPIPEIEGDNSVSPELLGLPEHLDNEP